MGLSADDAGFCQPPDVLISILVDPVEQKPGSDGELFPGVAEEGGVWVEGRTHERAFALFASVNVELHGVDDCVVFGEIFACHAGDSRTHAGGASTAKLGQRRSQIFQVRARNPCRVLCERVGNANAEC